MQDLAAAPNLAFQRRRSCLTMLVSFVTDLVIMIAREMKKGQVFVVVDVIVLNRTMLIDQLTAKDRAIETN